MLKQIQIDWERSGRNVAACITVDKVNWLLAEVNRLKGVIEDKLQAVALELKEGDNPSLWAQLVAQRDESKAEVKRLQTQLATRQKQMAVLRAERTENSLLRKHLSAISDTANDPAFGSDAMGWIAEQCKAADKVIHIDTLRVAYPYADDDCKPSLGIDQCPGGRGCTCCNAGCDCGCREACPVWRRIRKKAAKKEEKSE